MAVCQKCGYQNRQQARFCGYCGAPLLPSMQQSGQEPPSTVTATNLQGSAATQTAHSLAPSFHGSAASLFGITLTNIFWNILTLGIYRFWGKVRVQRYLAGQTEFAGDRFAYHGTGKELFIGFLKVLLVFGIPYLVLRFLQEWQRAGILVQVLASILTFILSLLFYALATVGARRYRLSRTSWRGIRFSFHGKALEFFNFLVGGTLLIMVTLSLYFPTFWIKRQHFLVSHAYFGSQPFQFDGRGRDLLGSYLIFLLLTGLSVLLFFLFLSTNSYILTILLIAPLCWFWQRDLLSGVVPAVTLTALLMLLLLVLSALPSIALAAVLSFLLLGLSWMWFSTTRLRYFWNHTNVAGARFHSTLPLIPYLLLRLENLFLLLITLGLGRPWVLTRSFHFAFAYLTLEGPLDFSTVRQEAPAQSSTEAGFFDFLDTGFDLG